ncbi:MAG: hypothetical protein Q9205_005035 [Flavoplaca limonia]
MPPSVRSSLRILREQNNHPENIRARILRDVAATMDAWREPPITEDMTREQLVAMIGRNINDDRADVIETHQSLEDLLTAPTTLLQPLPAPLAPLPRPQTETNGLTNGPAVQGAPPPQLSGGYEPDGRAVQNLVSNSPHGCLNLPLINGSQTGFCPMDLHRIAETGAAMVAVGLEATVESSEASIPVVPVAPVADLVVASTILNLGSPHNYGTAICRKMASRIPKAHDDVE